MYNHIPRKDLFQQPKDSKSQKAKPGNEVHESCIVLIRKASENYSVLIAL